MTGAGWARALYLVRHGESTWNVARRVQGRSARSSLTPLGLRQADAAAAVLADLGAVRLLTSDALRARQTAAVIARRLGLHARPTALLRERCWGVLEGRGLAEADEADARLRDHQAVRGGESRAEVRDRLTRLVEDLGPEVGPVVLVTHGDVIGEALRAWGGALRPVTLPRNGSVTRLDRPPPGAGNKVDTEMVEN